MKMIKFKNLKEGTKKKILIGIGVFAILVVAVLSVPKDVYSKIFNIKESNLTLENEQENKLTQLVYVMNSKNELVGVNVPVESNNEDNVIQKWELLTSKMATLPKGYFSPIDSATSLENYEVKDNILVLSLSNDFLNSDGKNALASIAWTYCLGDITEVVVKVEDEILTKLKDYQFFKIDKTLNVNYMFETSYLFEASCVTVLYKDSDTIKPVTYFFQDEEEIDYIVSKLLDDEIINNNAYTYTFENNNFSLNLAVDTVLTKNEIDEFKETMMLNFDLDSLVITNNVMTIYEEVFNIEEPVEE